MQGTAIPLSLLTSFFRGTLPHGRLRGSHFPISRAPSSLLSSYAVHSGGTIRFSRYHLYRRVPPFLFRFLPVARAREASAVIAWEISSFHINRLFQQAQQRFHPMAMRGSSWTTLGRKDPICSGTVSDVPASRDTAAFKHSSRRIKYIYLSSTTTTTSRRAV